MDIELFLQEQGLVIGFEVVDGDLAADNDLKTATLLSLFCDRRANPDDALPDESASMRGFWGDAVDPRYPNRKLGSRWWLLSREKSLTEVANRAREYAEEALAWLVEDRVVCAVEVDAQIVRSGWLDVRIVFYRERRKPMNLKFEFAWAGMSQIRS